ncbi:MAG: transketolase C-terminal domain-containing protein, partial [Bacillota bacterium]
LIDKVLKKKKLVVTVEEHSIVGGLGGAIAEYKSRIDQAPPMIMIGIEDFFPHAGDYEYMLQQCGLKADNIAQRILKKLNK